ncbi:MAG: hypothetical protein [Olavius algarvensis Delta 4 endosymbiont]|nr:MAG: hypothetical protein [Olavius algarvensis Delta 4 endosymbiont]
MRKFYAAIRKIVSMGRGAQPVSGKIDVEKQPQETRELLIARKYNLY